VKLDEILQPVAAECRLLAKLQTIAGECEGKEMVCNGAETFACMFGERSC
jgi:hypothetical protein